MHLRLLRANRPWRPSRCAARFCGWSATVWSCPSRSRVFAVCTWRACPALPAERAYPADQRRRPAGSRGARQGRAQRAAKRSS